MAGAVVVGAGVVGRATGMGLAQLGHDVAFCDIDQKVVDRLLTEGYQAGNVVELHETPTFVFLSVPTPVGRQGRYDLTALRSATVAVAEAIARSPGFHTVAIRSTVPPGTCDGVVTPLLQEVSGKTAGLDFAVASNPEFLRSRFAADDFLHPWMTVVGAHDPTTVERLRVLFAPLGGAFRGFDSPAEAELVKCAHNLFNATKISFWNEIGRVALRLGLDVDSVAETVALSAEGSFNPQYGIRAGAAFRGACLPKDTQGFLGFAAQLGVEMPILQGVIAVNQALLELENGSRGVEESLGLLDPR
jgi:UDPglucose 6-dehydrogenase